MEFKKYKNLVDFYTSISIEKYHLDGIEKRSYWYHLDHKFSVVEGFKQNIPPYIIGHINNLEMLMGRNNLVKNRKCSIDKDVLIDSILGNSETSIN